MKGSKIFEMWLQYNGFERIIEVNDKTWGLWVKKIRSRMHLYRHSLVISLTTKLNLRLIYTNIVVFFFLTEYSCLRHFSSIATFFFTWPNMWLNSWSNQALFTDAEHHFTLESGVISWLLISWLILRLFLFYQGLFFPSNKLFYDRLLKSIQLVKTGDQKVFVIKNGYI